MVQKHKSNELIKKQAEKGHNSEQLLKGYVEKMVRLEDEMTDLRGAQKDLLNDAKDNGFLKTAIKKAIKQLRKTDEQRQADNEVKKATEDYIKICSGLPLFEAVSEHTDEQRQAVGNG